MAPEPIIDDFIVNKYFLISNLIAILYRTKVCVTDGEPREKIEMMNKTNPLAIFVDFDKTADHCIVI